MQFVLERLIEKIRRAEIDLLPSDNFFIEDVFPPEIYDELLSRLPGDSDYDFIKHPDAVLPDGTKTRKLLDLTEKTIARFKSEDQLFWQQIREIMASNLLQQEILQKFNQRAKERFGPVFLPMTTVPILYRDFAGYRIREHTDVPCKVATMQFYFPKDLSQIHLGTSFHQRKGNEFILHKTNPFKPNSAYAFFRTENSWHSVKQLGQHEQRRDSLALTIYEQGSEYQSNIDPSKAAPNGKH